MKLPLIKSDLEPLNMLQTRWKSIIDTILGNPSLDSIILPSVSLGSGANVINHRLGRKLTGWRVARLRASATIYDTQDSNAHPELTLLLTSSAAVVCDLEVF